MFTEPILKYFKTQRLARIATVSKKNQPNVAPVGFEYDGTYFWIGSHSQDIFFRSYKYLNVKKGNTLVCIVIDDLESINPWKPRGVQINGVAEVTEHKGVFGDGLYLKITPKSYHAWGL